MQSFEDLLRRDSTLKHSATTSIERISVLELDFEPSSPKEWDITAHIPTTKSPADYENANLKKMEQLRQSLQVRKPSERAMIRNERPIDGPWSSSEAFVMYEHMQRTNFI